MTTQLFYATIYYVDNSLNNEDVLYYRQDKICVNTEDFLYNHEHFS